MRMDPNCPNPGIPDDCSLTAFHNVHDANTPKRKSYSLAHISQERWAEIFGPKPQEQISVKDFAKAWRKHAYR
jgi:hypothetical protein